MVVLTILFDMQINYKLCIMRIVTCSIESGQYFKEEALMFSLVIHFSNLKYIIIIII